MFFTKLAYVILAILFIFFSYLPMFYMQVGNEIIYKKCVGMSCPSAHTMACLYNRYISTFHSFIVFKYVFHKHVFNKDKLPRSDDTVQTRYPDRYQTKAFVIIIIKK